MTILTKIHIATSLVTAIIAVLALASVLPVWVFGFAAITCMAANVGGVMAADMP